MLGSRVFGLGAIVLGLVGLVWGDFAGVWQPVPASTPLRTPLAYITAICLLLAGAALFRRQTERIGALVLAILYFILGLLWLPRVIGYPQIFPTWGGMLEEFCLAAAALIVFARATNHVSLANAMRLIVGVCVLSFGVDHFSALRETAAMVPTWIPPNRHFWAMATGVAHLLAGLAIVTGIVALWAARCETAMIIGFGLLVWLPTLFAKPHDHTNWAGNGINLALAASIWITADWLAMRSGGKHFEEPRAQADRSVIVGRDH